jgi:hypothetical protein
VNTLYVNISTFIKTWDLKRAKYSIVVDEQVSYEVKWYKQHHVDDIEAVGTVHAEQSGLRVLTTTKSHWLLADGDKKRQTNKRLCITLNSS